MLDNGSENGMVMPVAPMYGNGGGFGGYGDGLFWIVILFLFAFSGGWSNGFGGYGNGGGTGYIASDVQRTADQASVMAGLSNIQNTLAGAEVSRCNMQANLTSQITNSAMAAQTNQAITQMGIADLKSVVQTEACADRQSVNDALRDVIAQNSANTQAILNQLNADKLDAKNEEISRLRQQLDMVSLADSQNQQTAQLISALGPQAPVAAYVVPNPYQTCGCGNNYGCGYGA